VCSSDLIRLAAQLGSNLQGVCYVLDEPTIGLHPRDNRILLDALARLGAKGNTLVVVEHDEDTIRRADHRIDIGPGAGKRGGRLVAEGSVAALSAQSDSVTGRFLAHPLKHPLQARRSVTAAGPAMSLRGAALHNLCAIDVRVPLQRLVAVTGVSGSGKSSLVFDVLAPSIDGASSAGRDATAAPVNCGGCVIHTPIARMVDVERASPAGSPWSTVATSLGVFDAIRAAFAGTDEARARGLRKTHFSTSAKGGRCEACEGLGHVRISMDFLPDVWIACDECGGKQYGGAALACRIDGASIADVLDMTADQARSLFARRKAIATPLTALHDVGLDYIRVGQPTRTLSGGERQRLVLAAALAGRADQPTLYLLDEPTKGLHADDVGRLLDVFDGLIAAGHSLVVVEHNLDVIRHADWVIDLGPEGGPLGGHVVAQGTPEQVARVRASHTGRHLVPLLHAKPAASRRRVS
jgi:excinuclease ABC subunit A